MTKKERLSKKYNSLIYNHLWLKFIIENGYAVFMNLLSAFIFSLGVTLFLNPSITLSTGVKATEMVSGGSSGLAQVLAKITDLIGFVLPNGFPTFYSIFYLLINIPLVIIAFKFIGKRFAILTLTNVGFVFLFTNLLTGPGFDDIALFVAENSGMLGRAFFAGTCTGLSSAFAYIVDASAGGFDIISYLMSEKKSTTTGKYVVLINGAVIVSFAILTMITKDIENPVGTGFGGIFFSSIYLLSAMIVIDAINVRNKKAQIQIITNRNDLHRLLLANIPHGATVLNGKGAYTDAEHSVIFMVVSTNEIKHVVHIIKQLDPAAFIQVTPLQQVYGHFHMKHVK